LACLGLGLTLACAREARPPNLLLITLDTTRRDHCSVYGYERKTTPNLERVAAEGVRFALAYAPSSTTAPSHATLFTSLYPITHRVTRNGRVLLPVHQTLAERVRERGWTTAGFVSSYVLNGRFGFGQGFEVWDDEFDPATATAPKENWSGADVAAVDRRGDATARRALAWLEGGRDQERPFFLFVHFYDPHSPYVPPPEFADRFPRRPLGPSRVCAPSSLATTPRSPSPTSRSASCSRGSIDSTSRKTRWWRSPRTMARA
jgi:arylsulfatase A-like enzyme